MTYRKRDIYTVTPRKLFFQKKLLAEQTPQEQALWSRLRSRQLGVTFVRQKVIVGYIVDFYCQKYKLAIEVDGSFHDHEKDSKRDAILRSVGVYVLRIPNDSVDNYLDAVVERIRSKVEQSERYYFAQLMKKKERDIKRRL